MTNLQEAARDQFEANKNARRARQIAGRDWDSHTFAPLRSKLSSSKLHDLSDSSYRLRSGSGTTTTSDSDVSPATSSYPHAQSSSSLQQVSSISSRIPSSVSGSHASFLTSTSTSTLLPMDYSPSRNVASSSANASSLLTPIATRMRERDADAIAEYKKRNRSGSTGTTSTDTKSPNAATQPTYASMSDMMSPPLRNLLGTAPTTSRRLRPSASAAQLRETTVTPVNVAPPMDQTHRLRAGTNPSAPRPYPTHGIPTTESNNSVAHPVQNSRNGDSRPSARRGATVPSRPDDVGDYTGPSSNFAIFPEPPDPRLAGPTTTTPTSKSSRRAGFAILSKPATSNDNSSTSGRHRRGTSSSDVRS